MSAEILIKNAKIVDPSQKLFGDLLIQDGVISAVGERLKPSGVPVIDGEGRTLLPAFIDLHAHFRDPGYTQKEDIHSGSIAAARGGYTAVSLMANTNPVCDRSDIASYIQKKAQKTGLVELFPVGAITRGLQGATLSDMDGLAPHVWAFSDDGMGVQRNDIMLRACQKAAALGLPLFCHCEFLDIPDRGLAEELMVGRDLLLARHTGCRLHIAHVSTAGAVELVSWAKGQGGSVTCEVTPHHLCLDREMNYTVNPPLPDRATREAIVRALREGLIDTIATDHAPHTAADKEKGMPGISGIETAFSLLYTCMVKEGALTLSDLSQYMSREPARILGLHKGALKLGYDGDVVLVKEDESFTLSEEDFCSKGANSPLLCTTLWGKVWATIHRGEVIYLDGNVKGRDFNDYRRAF